MKNFIRKEDGDNFNRDDSRNSTDNNLSQFKRDKRVRTKQVEKVERTSKPASDERSFSDRPHTDRPFSTDRPRPERPFSSRPTERSYNSDRSSDNRSYGDKGERSSYNPNFSRDNKPRSGGYSNNNDRGDRPAYQGNRDRDFNNDKPRYGSSDKPSYNSDKPRYGSSDRPAYNSDRPRYNSDKPRYGSDKPSYNSDKPRYGSSDRPAYNSDKPRYGSDSSRGGGFQRDNRGGAGRPSKYGDNSKFTPRPKQDPTDYPKYPAPKFDAEIRLNRYIAISGLCSRREADEYITSGAITVNGVVIKELGTKVQPTDIVKFNDAVVQSEKKVYILMNKPKGYVTTIEDEHADKTVMDLLKNACTERVYPVGRLDKNSVGVLLFTNDGDLTKRLTHPSYNKKKIYQVTLDKAVTRADMEQIATGITLDDGEIYADEIAYVGESKKEVGVEIHSGRNRIVRRMFEYCGYKVQKLDRVYFAGLTKKSLKRGAWRFLTDREVAMLKSGEYE